MFYVVSSPKHKHDSQKASSRMVKQILYIQKRLPSCQKLLGWLWKLCIPTSIYSSQPVLADPIHQSHTHNMNHNCVLRPRFSLRPDHQRKTGQRCLWPLCRGEVVRRKGSRTYIAWYGTDDVIFPLNRHIRNAIGCLICL